VGKARKKKRKPPKAVIAQGRPKKGATKRDATKREESFDPPKGVIKGHYSFFLLPRCRRSARWEKNNVVDLSGLPEERAGLKEKDEI